MLLHNGQKALEKKSQSNVGKRPSCNENVDHDAMRVVHLKKINMAREK